MHTFTRFNRRGLGTALLVLITTPISADPVLTLEPLVITVDRGSQTENQVTAPVTALNRHHIEQRQPRDIDDVLRDMPGVTTSGGPRSTAVEPNVRGLGGERVVIRLDGARQNFRSGHRGRVFLDPLLLEQVEVLRGPASTLHGSGALGGVVSFRTVDADSFLQPGETQGGRFSMGYQHNGEETFAALTAATRTDFWGLLASITYRDSDDLKDGDGLIIPNSGDEIVAGLLKNSWTLGDGHRLTLSWQAFNDDHRLPSAANTAATTNIVDRTTRQDTAVLRWQYQPTDSALWNVDAHVYYNRIALDERRISDGRFDETELDTFGVDVANTSRLTTAGGITHTLTYGLEAYRDDQDGRRDGTPRPQFPDAQQDIMAVFIQDTVGLCERLHITPGLRYDRFRQTSDDQPKRSGDELSLSLTAAWEMISGLQAYASYAEAFRSPSLTELYVGGLHFPGNVFMPNPDLRPEKAANKEVGLRVHHNDLWTTGDRLSGRLAVFSNDIEDLIDQRVEFDPMPPGPPMGPPLGRTLTENVRDARIRGAELSLRYDAPLFFAGLAATRLRGEDRDTGQGLGSIPADELLLNVGRRWTESDLEAGWRGTFTRRQSRLPQGGTETSGYTVHDLYLTWFPQVTDERLRLDIAVENLTDRTYRRHLSALNAPGRNVKLMASYRF